MFPSAKWVDGDLVPFPTGSCFASSPRRGSSAIMKGPVEVGRGGGVFLLESRSPCLCRAQMLLAEVSRERGELQGERGELRGRLARLELERAQLEAQSQRLRESNQQLDLSACRLTTQCEVW